MIEYFAMRLAPMLLLLIFGSLFLSMYLASKLDEDNFRNKTTYNLTIYSPYMISGTFILFILLII